ncbi:MAG: AAA family ATPase [Acidobacteria bacterium]|nr:AAA family ATPase [Acidobacteriota bacterium]MBV9478988.1 AAA family ATPase [Acidobacteriota bacterium]
MNHADGSILQFGTFHLAHGVELLYRGEEVVPLEPRAVRVLRYLVEHNDRVLSKEELLEEVWPDVFTTDGVLKKAVSQIRRTIGDDAEQSRFIATYHGRGYRFIAPVTRIGAATPKIVTTTESELVPNYDQLAARDAELLTLRAEFRSALEGSPRPVAIVGETGIGKTQLVRHFRRWAVEQGAISLYGRFFDYRGARLAPYELFIDLLRTAVVNGKPPDGTPLRDAIEAACGVRLPAELFEDSHRVDAAGAKPVGGNAGDHFRIIVPICRAWLALSRRQPLVIALDDLQWADPASLDVIGCLMRMVENEPLMLINIIRSGEAESADQRVESWLAEQAVRRTYTTVRLQRLGEEHCRDMIGRIFGMRRGGEVPRNDVETLYGLTGGNPYFLVETLRHLVAVGAIAPDAESHGWQWNGVRDLSLPETIVTAARAKINRLSERLRALLEPAAVIGEEFHVATLCGVAGASVEEVEELLSEGVRRGVLSIQGLTPGEDCRFQHSLLRRVVYDAIPPRRRRELHARTAAALESVYGAESERVAEALAAHHSAAGDLRRSFEAGMRAWRAASSRSEWRKAVALIQRVDELSRHLTLTPAESLDVLLALGESWRAAGRIRESAKALDRAVAIAASAGDPLPLGHALLRRGLTDIALSDYTAARASLAQALDLFLDRDDGGAISYALVHLAGVEASTGNYERAALLVEELRAGEPGAELAALADGIMGWSLALRGDYAEGTALMARALDYHDRAGEIRERALLLRRLHWAYLSRGDYEQAIELAVRARTDSETVGDVNGEAKANMGIGQAHLARGAHAEAISYLTRAIGQLKSSGDAHCEAECFWLLGRARCEIGALDESAHLLDRALTMIRRIGDRDDEFRILTDLARLAIARGDHDAGRARALEARDLAATLGNRQGVEEAEAELARCAGRAGGVARAGR